MEQRHSVRIQHSRPRDRCRQSERSPSVTARIKVKGQPNKMTLNKAQSLLYVADDQSDTVDVIDTTKNAVLESIPVIALPSSLALITIKARIPTA